jgi:hypothetical protein
MSDQECWMCVWWLKYALAIPLGIYFLARKKISSGL